MPWLPRRFFVVVHATTEPALQKGIDIAREGKADGAFLIKHGRPFRELEAMFAMAVRRSGDFPLGVNALVESSLSAIRLAGDVGARMVWTDNADDSPLDAFEERRRSIPWKVEYFGGVAFKYQKEPFDLANTLFRVRRVVDVITTSGPATGTPPDLFKVKTFADSLTSHRFGIASGLSPENIDTYLPWATDFLVASSLESLFGVLVPERVAAFAEKVRRFNEIQASYGGL